MPEKLRFRNCTSNLHLEHLDDFYGRTKVGGYGCCFGICVFFLSSPTVYFGFYGYLWWVVNRLYGKLHNLTRRNILKPHPPKPCLPKFCTRAVKEGPLVGGDEILARMNWEPVFFHQQDSTSPFFGCSVHSRIKSFAWPTNQTPRTLRNFCFWNKENVKCKRKHIFKPTNQPTFCPSWLSVWPPGTAQDLVLISDELINKGTETAETQRFYRFLNLL